MQKKYKTCLNIAKIVDDAQYQAFLKNIPTFQTQQDIYNELSQILKKQQAEIFARQLYQQIQMSKSDKKSNLNILIQIKKLIEDQKQFDAFKSKMTNLTLEEIRDQLINFTGKKKAQIIAKELYQQLCKDKQENCKSLIKIKQKLQDKQFQAFQKMIDKFTSVDQMVEELSNYMGKKMAKTYAESLFKQLGLNQTKKDKILIEIEKQIDNKEEYQLFVGKISNFCKNQELIEELSNYMKKQKAKSLGEELFNELLKNKNFKPNDPSLKQKSVPIKQIKDKKATKTTLNKVEELINDKVAFSRFQVKLADIVLIEDLIQQLSNYTNKKEAAVLAKELFKESGKDKIIYNKIEYMYRSLAQKSIDALLIQKIKNLVEQGKKIAVKRLLCQTLGQVVGLKLFNQYSSEIEQKLSQPIAGCPYINSKNGLKIHQYKESILESEKLGAKTIIVFGETGCGKSTFLNSVVNYIAGVEMEEEFRYKIIVENQDNQKNSITSKITSYYIKSRRNNMVYRLVDTPGFGDTGGVQKDNKIVEMVKYTFKSEIDSVHNILFLLKSSTTRVTPYQRYVFQSIMDLFNKNIAPNFVFIFTFSDSGKPQVLQSVQDSVYGFGSYWHLIQEPKYLEVNNCGIFQKIDLQDKIKVGYWQIGMMCMEKLFNKIHKIKPQSLNLSRQLLDDRQALSNKMRLARQKIENAIAKRQNLIDQLEKTFKFQEQIDNNKDFQYEVDVQQYYTQQTSQNVTRCITCTDCNCHQNCRFGDGQDKRQCVAFDKITGNCTVCPNSCHFTCHRNQHFLRKVRTVKKTKQNSVNKKIYEQSSSKLKTSQAIISSLMQQIDIVVKTAIESTKQMATIQKQLLAQQMSTKKPQSTVIS